MTPQEEQADWIKQLEESCKQKHEVRNCTLYQPLWVVIPPEGMIIDCPVHSQGHFIRPSAIITM